MEMIASPNDMKLSKMARKKLILILRHLLLLVYSSQRHGMIGLVVVGGDLSNITTLQTPSTGKSKKKLKALLASLK